MPREQENYQSNQTESYSKLLFEFEYGSASGTQDKLARSVGALKSSKGYDLALSSKPSGEYVKTAGCDLTALFMPFRISPTGEDRTMPFMDTVVTTVSQVERINPYQSDVGQTDTLVNRYIGPSGDSLPGVVSSDQYYGDVNQLRDPSDIRSVGLRMPMIGVGWGRTVDGLSWPSGSADLLWKGEVEQGSEVDPKDYVAAPIDFRYNTARKVWTCDTGQVVLLNSSGEDLEKYQVVNILGPGFPDPETNDNFLDVYQSDVYFIGNLPSGQKAWGNFGIVSHALENGKFGLCRINGLAHVIVDIKHENHEYADVISQDHTKLQSYSNGTAKIIYKATAGTGEKWCVVDLNGSTGDTMHARITGSGTSNGGRDGWYKAEEVVKSGASTWATVTDGAIWDDQLNNFGEIAHPDGNKGLAPASGETGRVVLLKRTPAEGSGDPIWIIVGGDSLPDGSGIYKVLQLDEDDEPHWDYIRAVEL